MRPLPPGQSPLPLPPPFTLRTTARVIGPGAILMGLAVGVGDWILGPAITARHGAAVLWVCTVSVLLQALLNTSMARYTVATGEPIFQGFMRTPPGAGFWGWIYTALHLVQTVWPGWALAAATALAAALLGRMPRAEDRLVVVVLGYLLFLGAVGTTLLGERTHRVLVRLEWAMTLGLLGTLLLVALRFVPWPTWGEAAAGFVAPAAGRVSLPADVDWALLVGFAVYSGAGGIINATLTYWVRDKGFGAASLGRTAPVTVGTQRVPLSQDGALLGRDADTLERWRGWWRHLRAALWCVWPAGCLVSMGLPALLALHYVARGTVVPSLGAGAFLPQALAERHGLVLWFPLLVAGGWVLFATQVGIAESFVRTATDLLWTGSARVRAGSGGRPAVVYYAALGAFTLGGCAALALADPITLILIGAAVAAANFALLAAHTLWVNRALLPRELRSPLWEEAGVLACGIFFAVLLGLGIARRGLDLF
jgi:hypothetical protein